MLPSVASKCTITGEHKSSRNSFKFFFVEIVNIEDVLVFGSVQVNNFIQWRVLQIWVCLIKSKCNEEPHGRGLVPASVSVCSGKLLEVLALFAWLWTGF